MEYFNSEGQMVKTSSRGVLRELFKITNLNNLFFNLELMKLTVIFCIDTKESV